MIRVYITRQSRYPADTKFLKEKVLSALSSHGVADGEVSVALVGERKMRSLGQNYLNETEEADTHEVLSFPAAETRGEFVSASDDKSLGDIAICYPEARKIAIKRNRMMDDVLGELAEHGTLHLLGIHHPE